MAKDWENLGLALEFDFDVIKSIEIDALCKTEKCCRELLNRWLNGEACQPVTWKRLIEAISDAERGELASELEQLFSS